MSGPSAARVPLPDGVTFLDVPWDDAHATRLRTVQQAEIAVRYADVGDTEPPVSSDVGRPIVAEEIVAALLLRVDGEAVGYAAVRDVSGLSDEVGGHHPAGTGEVKRVFVAPTHRGQGLARLLMREIEERSRAAGLSRLILETGTKQHESLALYRSLGFEPIDRYGEYAWSSESLCFAKGLSPAGPDADGALPA